MDLRLKRTRMEPNSRIVEAVVTESGDEGIEEMNEKDGRSVQEEGSWRCLGETAMNDISKVRARAS